MYLKFDKFIQDKSSDILDRYVIISQTDLNGCITNVSEAFCKISAYSKDELIGKTHNLVHHPDMSKKFYENLWKTIQSDEIWKGEIKNKAKDGRTYWIAANIEANYNEKNEIIGYTSIGQDITERKKLEAQHSIIVQQSKSAAMGEMISMIAHQWRQPLQAISLLAQKIPITKMLDNELTDEFLDSTIKDMMTQLNYMSSTIDDFRNFFKPDKKKEDISNTNLIKQTLDFLAYMVKVDSLDMKVEILEDISLYTHSNEVVQVLINIVKNARDILIETNDVDNRKISIKSYKEDNFCIMEIQDNAGGIKKEFLDKIFEAYFSTKTDKNGTGLGLYMSKTIIENHCNGNIVVQNKNDGALFTIILPIN